MIVTKTYSDGTTATGKHPLPKLSPLQLICKGLNCSASELLGI